MSRIEDIILITRIALTLMHTFTVLAMSKMVLQILIYGFRSLNDDKLLLCDGTDTRWRVTLSTSASLLAGSNMTVTAAATENSTQPESAHVVMDPAYDDRPHESGMVDAFGVVLFAMVISWYLTAIASLIRKENELLVAFSITDFIGVVLVFVYNSNRDISDNVQVFYGITYVFITTFLAVIIVTLTSLPDKLANIHSIIE